MSLILLRFACPECLAATHLSSPEVGSGLSWPKPQCTCNAMVTSQAQHQRGNCSNSACSRLMSDDLRLPRRRIEPRTSRFRGPDSTTRLLPLPIIIQRPHFTCLLSFSPTIEIVKNLSSEQEEHSTQTAPHDQKRDWRS